MLGISRKSVGNIRETRDVSNTGARYSKKGAPERLIEKIVSLFELCQRTSGFCARN